MNLTKGMQVNVSDVTSAGYKNMVTYWGMKAGKAFPDRDYCPHCGKEREMYGYMNDNKEIVIICSFDHIVKC